ncbi:YibE/F family protein [Vagococcus penaei]|uniref:YibE/F family protein n=1 Tax=Vagococcus penaei TaxID=633807 RepID=UPI000985FFB4|nr:YibE/F family protein [Vagococcus penaei]
MPKKKLLTWFFSGCILLLMSLAIYQTFNYSSYQETIANITKVTITNQENRQDEKQNTDTHYEQTLTLKILNGSHRGETMTTINHYSQSQISNHPYHKGNKVFVKINATTPNAVTIIDRKRDTALLILTTIFLIFLFMIAKKRGLFIFISLCLNSIIIGLLLIFYRQQPNNWLLPLIGLISPLLILSTLFLLNGWSKKLRLLQLLP